MSEDFQDLIDGIQGRLETEQEVLDAIKNQIKLHEDRVKRLKASLRALQQETENNPQKKRVRKGAYEGRAPTPEMIQGVLVALSEFDGPMSIKEIEQRTGRSHSATDYTVRYLRNQEMVRLAGKRGTANVYAPMNSTALKEAENGAAQPDAV